MVAIVAYGDEPTTGLCVNSFLQSARRYHAELEVTVILVQNDPCAKLPIVTTSEGIPTYVPLRSGQNLGYLGGALYALQDALLHVVRAPTWLVISNADLVVPLDFFDLCAGSGAGEGLRAPQVLDLGRNGHHENPFLQEPLSLSRALRAMVIQLSRYGHYGIVRLRDRRDNARRNDRPVGSVQDGPTNGRGPAGGVRPCYAVHGSCFIVSRQFLDTSEYMSQAPFLFGEEIYLAEQCRQAGLTVSFDDRIVVEHQSHVSTGRNLRSKEMVRLQRRAALRSLRLVLHRKSGDRR